MEYCTAMTQSKFRHNMDRSQKHIEKKPNTYIHTEYILCKSIYIKCKDRQKWPMVIDYKDQKSSYLWCVWRLRRAKRNFWNSGYVLFFELGGGSVQFSRSVVSDSLQPHEPQHARPPHSMPGLPVHHQVPESTQTHVHWVGEVITGEWIKVYIHIYIKFIHIYTQWNITQSLKNEIVPFRQHESI